VFASAWRELVEHTERREPWRWPSAATQTGESPPVPAEDLPRLSYLVCGTARSGSSLLCDALTATGVAGTPGEHFAMHQLRTVGGRWGAPDFGSYLAQVLRTTTTPNGVFGTKVLPEGFDELLAGLRTLPGTAGLAPAALLTSTLGAVHHIRISRRDRLRQAISLERAVQTGLWTSEPPPPALRPPRPRYSRAAIAGRLEALARQEARWDSFFRDTGCLPVEVAYEDLAADPGGTARRVLRELGIDVPDQVLGVNAALGRQADGLTDEWVKRFRRDAGA